VIRARLSGLLLIAPLVYCTSVQTEDNTGAAKLAPAPILYDLLRAELDTATANEIQREISAKAYAKAEENLYSRIKISAHPKVLLEILGGVFFLDSKYLDSAIAFKKAEEEGVLTEGGRFTLAMSYIELKRNAWARDELVRLRKEKPAQPLYSYWLGRLYYDDQRFADAEVNFRQALTADSQFIRAYDGMGLCEEAMGNMSAAEENYNRANMLNRRQQKRLAWPALDYGSMLRKAERYSAARALLNEALLIDPSLAKAYFELGKLEESLLNREAAIKNFSTAASLDPNDPYAVYSLYRLYRQAGDTNRAATMFDRFRILKQQAELNH
jgi:tetratricopeptide (TPR) repeat protein